uniref:Glycosyltransferase n=1 Tax=Rhizophora mucronata TaxID=61149 RepID=A0A2P2P572_RHIMU
MESKSNQQHVVMLPVMAHGHLIPFLALARKIHRRTGFTITIANTPLNIQYLRSSLNSQETGIKLAELPFCGTDHGLPPNVENTENLSLEQMVWIFEASLGLKSPFHRLLSDVAAKEGRPPLCVISDFFFGWASEVAESLGTVNVTFATPSAYGYLALNSIWLNLPHRLSDSDGQFHVPGFPENYRFHISQLHEFMRKANGNDSWSRFLQPQLSLTLHSFGWLCNTVEEIEPLSLDWLRKLVKQPVWAIGPLFPAQLLKSSSTVFSTQRAGKQPGISAERCKEWLGSYSPGSVVYISFGSQNTITPCQMMELAIGLEESGQPFIWVIRPPTGFDRKGEFSAEWLPEGFAERMDSTKQGLLVPNWAPQLEILCHRSTGVFLSHCGWNGALESLSQGVPIIGWPMAAEQAFNSKMLVEEMGVSVELARGKQDNLTAKKVKEVIELVMDKKGKGQEMKRRAVDIGEKIRAAVKAEGEGTVGSSVKALDDMFRTLLSKREAGN